MGNLTDHAEREMRLAGLYDTDADYGGMIPEAVMALVKAHAAQGHSGGSHHLTLRIFNEVANFKTLTPITSDPATWTDVSEMGGRPMWQSKRQPSVFSEDGGATWYDLDAPRPAPSDGAPSREGDAK